MTRVKRRILFYLLVVLFLLGGTGMALYAQGWRLDWEKMSFSKVGALYLRSFPPEANIFLDGKPQRNRSGFLTAGTLINNLFPRNYDLRLELPGYKPWTRTAPVRPALVTEIKYAVMVPEAAASVATGTWSGFRLINSRLLLQDGSLANLGGVNLPGGDILGITQNGAGIQIRAAQQGAYLWYDARNATSTNLSSLLPANFVSPDLQLLLDPESNSSILIQDGGRLHSLNFVNGRLTLIASSTQPVEIVASSPSWIAWTAYDPVSDSSDIFAYDRLLGINRPGGKLSGRIRKLGWAPNETLGILRTDGEFHILDSPGGAPRQLASDVRDFVFSPQSDKVALLENSSLEIFSLRNRDYWRFNLPRVGEVRRLVWYRDGWNLFVEYPGEIRLLGLEDVALETFELVSESQQMEYHPQNNILYFLRDGTVYSLRFPQ